MAATAQALAGKADRKMAKIVNFAPEAVKAPFFLRVAAAILDYMLLMSVPVLWLLMWRFVGDGTTASIGMMVWVVWVIVFVSNFLLLPLLTGRTLGKMLTGITIINSDGSDARLVGLLLRCTLGYLATVMTLGIGFLIAGVNSSGRTLHDFIGGTVVVRARKTLI
jgi:uncharacterized RDD family membrane protein YckC